MVTDLTVISSSAFSPDLKSVAIAYFDSTVIVYDMLSSKEKLSIKTDCIVNYIIFSRDNSYFYLNTGRTINIFNAFDASLIKKIESEKGFSDVFFTDSGNLAFKKADLDKLVIWDYLNDRETYSQSVNNSFLLISNDSILIEKNNEMYSLKVFESFSAKKLFEKSFHNDLNELILNEAAGDIVFKSGDEIFAIDYRKGLEKALDFGAGKNADFGLNADKTHFVYVQRNAEMNKDILYVRNARDYASFAEIDLGFNFSENYRIISENLLVNSAKNLMLFKLAYGEEFHEDSVKIFLFDLNQKKILRSVKLAENYKDIRFSPNGKYLLYENMEGYVVEDLDSGIDISFIASSYLYKISFSADDNHIILISSNKVHFIDPKNLESSETLIRFWDKTEIKFTEKCILSYSGNVQDKIYLKDKSSKSKSIEIADFKCQSDK